MPTFWDWSRTRDTCEIESIRSNVDKTDSKGIIFSRDCAEYEVRTPNGVVIHVLVNHFKSQSGGGGAKRKRQAKAVRKIVNELVQGGAHVVVLGDLKKGQPSLALRRRTSQRSSRIRVH